MVNYVPFTEFVGAIPLWRDETNIAMDGVMREILTEVSMHRLGSSLLAKPRTTAS